MSGKMTKFKDLLVDTPNRYTVNGEVKTIVFSPNAITQEGTKDKAEYFNEMQKNGLYNVNATRVVEGTVEFYDVSIDGSDIFDVFDTQFIINFNETNTKLNPVLRFNGNNYYIRFIENFIDIDVPIGYLQKTYICFLDSTNNKVKLLNYERKLTFDTIADAQASTWLVEGDIIEVLGYYSKGDGGRHYRKIESTDDGSGIAIGGLFANYSIEKNIIYIEHFGCQDNISCSSEFKKVINYVFLLNDSVKISSRLSRVLVNDVDIDINKDYTFDGIKFRFNSSTYGLIREAIGGDSNLNSSFLKFLNCDFYVENETVGIFDDMDFASSQNLGIKIYNCNFYLDGNSTAISMGGTGFNDISNNFFKVPLGSTCIRINANDGFTRTVMESKINFNTFKGSGDVFDCRFNASTTSTLEGFDFIGNKLFVSKVYLSLFNSLKIVNNHFVSSDVVLDSCNGAYVSGNYFDTTTKGTSLLTFDNAYRNVQYAQIIGNQFNRQGTGGKCLVFNGSNNTYQTTSSIIKGNTYVGGTGANPIDENDRVYAITNNNSKIRNILIESENFINLYCCINLTGMLSRSTIGKFEAREITYYALGIPSFIDKYVRCDNLYKVFNVNLMVPTFVSTSTDEPIYSTPLIYEKMLRSPIISVTPVSARVGFSITVSDSYDGYFYAMLFKLSTASPTDGYGDKAYATAKITLDSTKYIAPR